MAGCERTSEQRPPISRHFVKPDRTNSDIVYTIDILTANGFRIMHYKFMFLCRTRNKMETQIYDTNEYQ